uniref:Uncharacterized protein n=1 Tax=Arundo donax TaxID=35708 RepID=A0A0A9A3A6_ARUDO
MNTIYKPPIVIKPTSTSAIV